MERGGGEVLKRVIFAEFVGKDGPSPAPTRSETVFERLHTMVDLSPSELLYPSSTWETIAPEDAGLDPQALSAAADLLGRPHSNARAFLVTRGGRIACERYYQGNPPENRLHLFSVTKSVVSALIGIALQEGALSSLDQRVVDFFPEIPISAANPLSLLTLRHLLTMTTGMAWPGGRMGREPMFARLVHAPDWARFILSVPVRRAEIGVFHYNSAASHLLSLILTRATGQTACAYAAERLFAPLGIAAVHPGTGWMEDPQGNSIGGWGLHLNARELARFGLLYLRGGKWTDREILPASWVQDSTNPAEEAGNGYGYQWWLRWVRGEKVFAGLGLGGQYLFCVPGRDLLVVILSQPASRWPDRWEVLDQLVRTAFLP